MILTLKTLSSNKRDSKASVLDAYSIFLYLSIGIHASIFLSEVLGILVSYFCILSLLPGFG
jgi:hypothetical protein